MPPILRAMVNSGRLRVYICPGNVVARDGDIHYVGAAELAKLYGIPRDFYRVFDADRAITRAGVDLLDPNNVFLGPREDGVYSLETLLDSILRARR